MNQDRKGLICCIVTDTRRCEVEEPDPLRILQERSETPKYNVVRVPKGRRGREEKGRSTMGVCPSVCLGG